MLHPVHVGLRNFAEYRSVIDAKLFTQIRNLAQRLAGLRVLHINSNPSRGGVAEMLGSSVPLLRDLGINAHWHSIKNVPLNFYSITKHIHNGLQGDLRKLETKQWQLYENFNRRLAKSLRPEEWDFIFVHDHQPAAALSFLPNKGSAKWLWRSHIDSTKPNPSYQQRYLRYLKPYDGALFTLPAYVFKNFHPTHLMISPPAIDPFSSKNLPIKKSHASKIVATFGINPKLPFVSQVSRLDPWKDLPGVVKAWQLAKQQLPELQLALISNYSPRDPQAKIILKQLKKASASLSDMHLIVNRAGPRAIKAFQVASSVVLQKSTREGFGLTVAEAFWSNTPVIGGNVGGIRLQIKQGKNGYLVNSIPDCANKIVKLIQDPLKRHHMSKLGHELVRKQFLLPRMVRDELELMLKMIQ